jgi:Xaa-Pro aminopeptidase
MSLPDTATLAARHARVRRTLDALTVEALVVTNGANIRYLTNHVGTAGVVVLTQDAVHLLVDFRYAEAVRALQQSESACPGLRTWQVPASYEEALVECLTGIGLSVVAFEAAHLTVARHDWLSRTLAARQAGIELRSTERIIEQARVVKDAFEIAALREAAARIGAVADAAFRAIAPGRAEQEVAGVIEAAMRTAGYEGIAFDTIVASGPNAALPHHRACSRALTTGDLVVLDFGGVLRGYCCDLTRTVSVGPPVPEARRVYAAVLEAQQAAIAAVRPGVEASAVDAAARGVLEMRGLGSAFGHGTGHGLGLDVHEEPRVGRRRQDLAAAVLEPGMAFTIEPGAYLPGFGGVRIEDDVLVTKSGCDVLTSVTHDLLAL